MNYHSNTSKSEVRLQVVGTGANDIEPMLSLLSSKNRYWFNCSEGTSRYTNSVGLRLGKPTAFITHASWRNMSGWIALYKKYMERLKETLHVQFMGPLKGQDICQSLLRQQCGKNSFECISKYEDNSFSISSIELGKDGSLVAYSCKQLDISKLDYRKACLLDVPQNAMGDLWNGKSFVTSSGELIQLADIVKTLQGGTFVILECPSEDYVRSICDSQQLQPDWFKERHERLDFIVHITPLKILEMESYCRWMSSFGPEVHHVLLHSSVCPAEVSWQKSIEFCMGFHFMNPKVFKFPFVDKSSHYSVNSLALHKFVAEDQVTVGCSGLQMYLKPGQKSIPDFSKTLSPLETSLKLAQERTMQFCDSPIKRYHKTLPGNWMNDVHISLKRSQPQKELLTSNDAIVTFLGTSGCISNNYRSETAIMVQTKHGGNILLDCGEGTSFQLKRQFGEKASEVLINLRTVFISHMHPDHWAGLLSLLQEHQNALSAIGKKACPVNIVAPPDMYNILDRFISLFGGIEYVKIDFRINNHFPVSQNSLSLKVFPVSHVESSYGVTLFIDDAIKIVYSGDTRPCNNLVKEGKDANLLIHDATFCDEFEVVDKVMKRHSFYSEAVKISKACNASLTVLTHFSNKNTLYPLAKQSEPSVMAAVDFMSLRLSDVNKHRLDSTEAANVYKSIEGLVTTAGDDSYWSPELI